MGQRRRNAQPHGITRTAAPRWGRRSEEHTSELQSRRDLVCRLLLEKKKKKKIRKILLKKNNDKCYGHCRRKGKTYTISPDKSMTVINLNQSYLYLHYHHIGILYHWT